MIPPLQAVRKILWGNVILNDGRKVPVIKRSYPYDKTPCITIDDSGGSKFIDRFIVNEKYPLSNNHPQFNQEEPFLKYPQQVLREYYETTLNINVWCDTESEREELNNKIIQLFYEAQSDHYKFCTNYNDGECASQDTHCFARHFLNNRSVKKQCPNPLIYNYENVFKKYNLIRASFHLNQPFSLDDTNTKNEVLRSVLKLDTGYYIDHIIGGYINNKVISKV